MYTLEYVFWNWVKYKCTHDIINVLTPLWLHWKHIWKQIKAIIHRHW